jgi:thiamine transport system ATP-binding protein
VLRIDQLSVAMEGGSFHADMTLEAGRRVAAVGPSGAGKSTLLDAIAGFRPAAGGRILWQGQDLTRTEPANRPVSILFQDGNLFPHLSVARNLALALRPDGWRLTAEQTDRLAAALHRVGLKGFGDRMPATLSGGQRSRVALARVVLQARPVLLLDEPFAALGPAMKAEMLDLVQDIGAETGALVLLVTHDPQDAQRFAQQMVLVVDGAVQAPVPAKAFFDAPPKAYRDYVGGKGSDPL